MTLVGKIFTVLIFVMSIVFMAFSIMVFATHTNWRERAEKLKGQVTQQEQLVVQAKADHDKTKRDLAQEQASRRQALAALQTKLKASPMALFVTLFSILTGNVWMTFSSHVLSAPLAVSRSRSTDLVAATAGGARSAAPMMAPSAFTRSERQRLMKTPDRPAHPPPGRTVKRCHP